MSNVLRRWSGSAWEVVTSLLYEDGLLSPYHFINAWYSNTGIIEYSAVSFPDVKTLLLDVSGYNVGEVITVTFGSIPPRFRAQLIGSENPLETLLSLDGTEQQYPLTNYYQYTDNEGLASISLTKQAGNEHTMSIYLGTVANIATLEPITISVAPSYQPWASYPDSPLLTTIYPYQVITIVPTFNEIRLTVAYSKIYRSSYTSYKFKCESGQSLVTYVLTDNVWVNNGGSTEITVAGTSYQAETVIDECNNDVYTDINLDVVLASKTTP